jgi:hypothetical protein
MHWIGDTSRTKGELQPITSNNPNEFFRQALFYGEEQRLGGFERGPRLLEEVGNNFLAFLAKRE